MMKTRKERWTKVTVTFVRQVGEWLRDRRSRRRLLRTLDEVLGA